jgi:enolase
MGVLRAVDIINNVIAPKLVGVGTDQQVEVDKWLIAADGTDNKSKLGANSILAVSQLFLKAGAYSSKVPVFYYINKLYERLYKEFITIEKIPTPIFNIINGGKHANNTLQFQEFQIIPSSSLTFAEALRVGAETFHELKDVLLYRNATVSVGEEGGFAPNLSSNAEALAVIKEAVANAGYQLGTDVTLALDCASSEFYKDGKYVLAGENKAFDSAGFADYLADLCKEYPIISIEDDQDESD